jgi:hypothetical protein
VINLEHVYTLKQNAARAMKKAIVAGEYGIGELKLTAVANGYQVVLAAKDEAAWKAAEPIELSKPLPAIGELAAMAASLPDADTIDVAMAAGLSPAEFAKVAKAGEPVTAAQAETMPRTSSWPYVRAIKPATRSELKKARAEIKAGQAAEARAEAAAEAARTPAASKAAATKAADAPAESVLVLRALLHSPELLGLPMEQRAGVWITYRSLADSTAPHGLPTRTVTGIMGGLYRRGLAEYQGASKVRVTDLGLRTARRG